MLFWERHLPDRFSQFLYQEAGSMSVYGVQVSMIAHRRSKCMSLTALDAAAAGCEPPDPNRPQTERRAARAATQRYLTRIGPQAAAEGGTAMNGLHNAARVTPGDLLKSAIVQKVLRR